jgi:N-acyl-L-homoserine lactone synthetase
MNSLINIDEQLSTEIFPPGTIPPETLDQCVCFRTAVYLSEGYINKETASREPDEYDDQSAHFCIKNSATAELLGYCRMIHLGKHPLPIEHLYAELIGRVGAPVEISCFSIPDPMRGKMSIRDVAPLFKLAKALFRYSHDNGITAWSCMIDDRFRHLCRRFFRLDFKIIGETRHYMGSPSTPCLMDLRKSAAQTRNHPDLSPFWDDEELKVWIDDLK